VEEVKLLNDIIIIQRKTFKYFGKYYIMMVILEMMLFLFGLMLCFACIGRICEKWDYDDLD
tara:strand:+ start:589 stop:771 length:183 start_codon:yes stop_codon:yes gene_type:complete